MFLTFTPIFLAAALTALARFPRVLDVLGALLGELTRRGEACPGKAPKIGGIVLFHVTLHRLAILSCHIPRCAICFFHTSGYNHPCG